MNEKVATAATAAAATAAILVSIFGLSCKARCGAEHANNAGVLAIIPDSQLAIRQPPASGGRWRGIRGGRASTRIGTTATTATATAVTAAAVAFAFAPAAAAVAVVPVGACARRRGGRGARSRRRSVLRRFVLEEIANVVRLNALLLLLQASNLRSSLKDCTSMAQKKMQS